MSADISNPAIQGPEHCQTMAEVRAGVDDVDRALVALLQTRFGYMDAAARVKSTRNAVRDEARKAQVIANVRAAAIASDLPEELLAQLWEILVEGSIAYELNRWDQTRG
jgi:isochorismate pyruvate lyase